MPFRPDLWTLWYIPYKLPFPEHWVIYEIMRRALS